MKKLFATLFCLFLIPAAYAQIQQFPPGFRLTDGTHLNQLVDAVNNLTGGGTPGPITGTTGVFSGNVTVGGNLGVTGNGTIIGTLGVTGVTTFTAIPVAPAGGITLGSTTFSEATLALYAKGVAAGYKIARGETNLDGSNPTPVATGLATIVSCTAAISTSVAPGVSTSLVTYTTATATLNLYGWKPTDATNNTLIASTATDTIGWLCVGT